MTTGIKGEFKYNIQTDENKEPQITSIPIGYTPEQIRHAYGLNKIKANGHGQTIAIIDAFLCPTILEDFRVFDKQFDIDKPHNLKVFSFSSVVDEGWALEQSLDVQWVHAIAPHAKILLIQANTNDVTDLLKAVQFANNSGASVISMSWGALEFLNEEVGDAIFTKENIVYVAASGDTGDISIWPSSSPYVLSVGGTSLKLNKKGKRIGRKPEIAWNGSGGGSSLYENLPDFQEKYGLTGTRQTPDVSFFADPNPGVPVYNTTGYNGRKGWFQVGGTSLGTQCFAGIILLANELREKQNKKPLSNIILLNYLYNEFGKGKTYKHDFYDIIYGCSGPICAHVGYDNVTGLGSPKNHKHHGLIHDLVHRIH